MSCGAADFWEATGLPEKRCAHSYCIPALRACTSTVHLTLFRLIRFDLYIYVYIFDLYIYVYIIYI